MHKYIVIKADVNDGDYITEKTRITDENLVNIMPVIEAIKNFKPYIGYSEKFCDKWTHSHNFPYGDSVREDLGQKSALDYYIEQGIPEEQVALFIEFIPTGEYGIHTIQSIEILEVINEIKLL